MDYGTQFEPLASICSTLYPLSKVKVYRIRYDSCLGTCIYINIFPRCLLKYPNRGYLETLEFGKVRRCSKSCQPVLFSPETRVFFPSFLFYIMISSTNFEFFWQPDKSTPLQFNRFFYFAIEKQHLLLTPVSWPQKKRNEQPKSND